MDELEEEEPATTFCERVKRDFKIVKENFKTTVVWRFYLYWLLVGLEPSFSGVSYYWMKDVYKIT